MPGHLWGGRGSRGRAGHLPVSSIIGSSFQHARKILTPKLVLVQPTSVCACMLEGVWMDCRTLSHDTWNMKQAVLVYIMTRLCIFVFCFTLTHWLCLGRDRLHYLITWEWERAWKNHEFTVAGKACRHFYCNFLSPFFCPAVCQSIREPVTKEILLEYLDRCAQGAQSQNRKNPRDPDSELMPPPPPKRPNRAIP